MDMKQLVNNAVIIGGIVAAIAVVGMVLLGWREGDGLAQSITGNLQAIALALVVSIGSIVSHYLGVASSTALSPGPATPLAPTTPPPAAPTDGGTSSPAGA